MCGRFTLQIPPELLAEIFGCAVPDYQPRYNIAPSQQVLVARQDSESHIRLDFLRWGLIPSWSKTPSIDYKLINARCESVHEKPAFKQAIRYRRCLVPASGFIEWESRGGKKFPFHVCLKGGSPMVIAGLWESWKPPDGQVVETCTILTTAPNKVVARLHDRMPVILHPAEFDLWLDRDMHDPERLKHLFQPYPADLVEMHEVSPQLNSTKTDSPYLLFPVQPSESLPLGL